MSRRDDSENDSKKDGFFLFDLNLQGLTEKGATSFLQCLLNAAQRHAFQVPKVAMDNGGFGVYCKLVKESPMQTMSLGFPSRFAGGLISIGPATTVRRFFIEQNPSASTAAQVAVATAAETVPGAALELRAAQRAFSAMGVSLTRTTFSPAYFSALPLYGSRNACGWFAAFLNSDSTLVEKLGYGAAAGVVSAPLDTLGSKLAMGAAKSRSEGFGFFASLAEAYKNVGAEIFRDPAEFAKGVAKGVPFRVFPGAVAAVVFSDKGTKAISGVVNSSMDFFGQLLHTACKEFMAEKEQDNPAPRASAVEVEQVKKLSPEREGKTNGNEGQG